MPKLNSVRPFTRGADTNAPKAEWIRGNALPRVSRFRLMGCFVQLSP
jgi:hypothetical protein